MPRCLPPVATPLPDWSTCTRRQYVRTGCASSWKPTSTLSFSIGEIYAKTPPSLGSTVRDAGGRGLPVLDDALRDLRLKPVHDAYVRYSPRQPPSASPPRPRELPRGPPRRLRLLLNRQGLRHAPELRRLGRNICRSCWSKCKPCWPSRNMPAAPRAPCRIGGSSLKLCWLPGATDGSGHPHPELERQFAGGWPEAAKEVLPTLETRSKGRGLVGTVLAGRSCMPSGFSASGRSNRGAAKAFEALRLREPMAEAFHELGLHDKQRWQAAARVRASFAMLPPTTERTRQPYRLR